MNDRRPDLPELLNRPGLIVAPGVFDALSARVAESHNVPALYVSGACAALSMLGQPDIGLITGPEMADHTRRIAEVVDTPLIVDGDTGYGNVANVRRTVRLYEDAGAAAIQLEDQEFPKRCGHLPDKRVVTVEDHEGRIRAACDSRRSDDFKIIARTDARAPLGLEAAIDRANRYRAAGADILFVEAPQSRQEIETIAEQVEGPLMINMISNSVTPVVGREELIELGYKIAIYPIILQSPAVDAMNRALVALAADGDDRSVKDLAGPRDLFDIADLDEWNEFVSTYE